jgi:O-antigen/teichoic acid export membrane protein
METEVTSGKLIVKNSILSIFGKLIPMLLAIVTMPYVINALGDAKAGIFQLCWILLGYFNLFDFGLSRGLVKFTSEYLANRREAEIKDWLTTVNRILWLIAIPLILIFLFALPSWMTQQRSIPSDLVAETRLAAILITLYLPFLLTFSSYNGILETYQRFSVINRYQILFGVLWYVVPVALLLFTRNLSLLVGMLILLRLIHWFIIRRQSQQQLSNAVGVFRYDLWVQLKKYSRWIVMINIIALLITQIDRFLVYHWLSSAALAWYNTPFDMVLKVTIIPMAFSSVLFPAIAHLFNGEPERAHFMYKAYVHVTILLVFPICLVMSYFAPEILQQWLGLSLSSDRLDVFLRESTLPMKLFGIGVFFNSIALIPSSYLQSSGQPSLIARLHLVELPLYLFALWWVIEPYGLSGVALVTSMRLILDALMMVYLADQSIHVRSSEIIKTQFLMILGLFLLSGSLLSLSILPRVLIVVAALTIYVYYVWIKSMSAEEKNYLLRWFRQYTGNAP